MGTQKGPESTDPALGWAVGRAALGCAPGRAPGAQGARGRFGRSSSLLPSSHLANPGGFGTRAGAGWFGSSPGSAVGAASSLTCSVAKGKCLEPDLGPAAASRTGLLTAERGESPNPCPCALQHSQALETGAACACSICWEPGEGWPCQMCEHSWAEAMPTSPSSYFNPRVGLLVPPEPLLHIPGVGVAAQHSAPSWVDLTLFYSFTFCIFLHPKGAGCAGGSLSRLPAHLNGAASVPCTLWSATLCPGEVTGTPGSGRNWMGLHTVERLPLNTSAGEARGREKQFQLPRDVDIRITR